MAVRRGLYLPTPGVNPRVEHVLSLTHPNKEVEEIVLAKVSYSLVGLTPLPGSFLEGRPELDGLVHRETV